MSQLQIQNPKSKIRNSGWLMVGILLLAAAFRFLALDAAPPGWRDDELIEFGMDRRIAQGWRPLFITEAEGHEPFYHYLHAGTLLLFGENIVGYKWLPFAFGLLAVALTFALAKRLFDVRVAWLAAALMAVSFWPIMYARLGLRHIGILPLMLSAFLLLYRRVGAIRESPLRVVCAGVLLAAALMTYFAGRALPVVLIGFLVYLLIFNRSILSKVWLPTVAAIAIAVAAAAPMFVEISRTPGAEKRTEVVGGPLIAAQHGNFKPAIDTMLGTLGMFTFAGDPESLYNVSDRPVFDWITGVFFYLGVLLCLVRLKRVESGFTLAWLFVGLAPAFVSLPAASFSHTIAAQPVVYIIAAFGVVEVVGKLRSRQGNKVSALPTYFLVSLCVIGIGGWLSIRDYFGTWANDPFVRFQYHAPTRDVAKWLERHEEFSDVAIGTHPNQLVLDPVALKLDLKRNDVRVRWFDPEAALVFPISIFPTKGLIILTPMQSPGQGIKDSLAQETQFLEKPVSSDTLKAYVVKVDHGLKPSDLTRAFAFEGWLGNIGDSWQPPQQAGTQLSKWVVWQILNPPPVSLLKSFVHLLNSDGQVVSGSDRADFNFATLVSGDVIYQLAILDLPHPGVYRVETGWYYPKSGQRLILPDGQDHYLLPNKIEVTAP